jgi:hypothetical protein
MLPDPGAGVNSMAVGADAVRENPAVRKSVRRILGLGVLAGVGYAVWRAISSRSTPGTVGWQPQPFPFPPQPAVDTTSPWVDAADNGACPAHHPVKAKLASGIFHVPGGANYTRTLADRCYLSAEAAEADGLRRSKR